MYVPIIVVRACLQALCTHSYMQPKLINRLFSDDDEDGATS